MSESFAALFEESLTRSNMKTGQVISAEVVRIDHNFVVVNAGLKSEAFIPVEEFQNDQGELEVNPGDFVSVAIDALENGYGDTILSRDKAKRLASWMNLEKALEGAEIVALVNAGELTDKLARQVVEGVIAGEGKPSEVVTKRGIKVVNDDGALMAAIEKVCAEQAETAEKVRNGHLPAAGALIGAVMKETKGQADAAKVRSLLLTHLGQSEG